MTSLYKQAEEDEDVSTGEFDSEEFLFQEEEIQDESAENPNEAPETPKDLIDYEKLASVQARTFKPILDRLEPQKPAEKPISEEEFAKLTDRFNPDEAFVQRLFDPAATREQQVAALRDFVTHQNKHVYKVLELALQARVSPLQEKLSGYEKSQLETLHAQQEAAFVSDLYKIRPDLKEYKPIVAQAIAYMKQSNYTPQGTTEAQRINHARHHVMSLVQQQIRTVNPNFSFEAKPSRRTGMPAMAPMAGAGATGNSSRSGGGKQPAWLAALGG